MLASDPVLNGSCAKPESTQCYVCLHKSLFPLGSIDAYGTALLFLAGVLAGASGIGGGGLNVPLLMLVQGFIIEEAVPLSHVMVLGNSIAQNLVNLQRRHPRDARRPLVDFDIPVLLLPMQLGGNALGVTLSPVLPSTVLILLSCAVLVLAAAKTLHRAVKDFKQESLANRSAVTSAASIGAPSSDLGPLLDAQAEQLSSSPTCEPGRGPAGAASGSHDDLLTTGSSSTHGFPALSSAFPATWACAAPESSPPSTSTRFKPRSWWQLRSRSHRPHELPHASSAGLKVGSLVVFWAFFVADYFGVQATHAHNRCSALYLGWQVALLFAVGISSAVGAYLARQTSRGRASLAGDILWTAPTIVGATCLALLIGMVAGLIGLGGGELMAPLLLALGMLPQVASSTSAFMILFTSSSNLVHYLFEGVLTPQLGYVVWALGLGFCSALIGRLMSFHLVQKLHHPSLLIFSLGTILLLALALLMVRSAGLKENWMFAPLCGRR